MIIGITGVFGSGKTAVAQIFAKYSYRYVNADEIGHLLLDKKEIKEKVIEAFGNSILTNGKIDRRKLKDIVFYEHSELIKLNKIVHPAIINEIKSIIKESLRTKSINNNKIIKKNRLIIEGALLIEAKCLDIFDKLIVVKINPKEQMKRALAKKKYTLQEIKNIIKSQLSQKEKLKYADIVVDNSRSLKDTEKKVNKIIDESK